MPTIWDLYGSRGLWGRDLMKSNRTTRRRERRKRRAAKRAKK